MALKILKKAEPEPEKQPVTTLHEVPPPTPKPVAYADVLKFQKPA
jgi:hypothetical protein